MHVEPLGPLFGARITEVDLANPGADTVQRIRSELVRHEVLVFPAQHIRSEDHIAFGRAFGELTVSPFSPNADDAPELIVLDNGGDRARPLTDIWHSDETFRPVPPMATVLRARIVPAYGGDTLFASMTAAYDGLSERMRTMLAGLNAVHGFGRFGELMRADPERVAQFHDVERRQPAPHHPVIRVHPESGRRAIFVNAHFVERIVGIPEDESRALLNFLFTRAQVAEYQLRVQWEPDMVVMWDNRSVQHYAPNDYLPQRRRMERVTIRGDVPEGVSDAMPFTESARGIEARNTGHSIGDAGASGDARRQFEREDKRRS